MTQRHAVAHIEWTAVLPHNGTKGCTKTQIYPRDRDYLLSKRRYQRGQTDHATMRRLRKMTLDDNGKRLENSVSTVVRSALSRTIRGFLETEEHVGNETYALASHIVSRGRLSHGLPQFVLSRALKSGALTDDRVFNNLLGSKASDSEEIVSLLTEHQFPTNITTYNSLIQRLQTSDKSGGAFVKQLSLYRKALENGLFPTKETVGGLLSGCSKKTDFTFLCLGLTPNTIDLSTSSFSVRKYVPGKRSIKYITVGDMLSAKKLEFASSFAEATSLFEDLEFRTEVLEKYLLASSRVGTLKEFSHVALLFKKEERNSNFFFKAAVSLNNLISRYSSDPVLLKQCVNVANGLVKEATATNRHSLRFFMAILDIYTAVRLESLVRKLFRIQLSIGIPIVPSQRQIFSTYFGRLPKEFTQPTWRAEKGVLNVSRP